MIAALRFLTVLPLPGPHRVPTLASVVAFPLVGAVIGLVWFAVAVVGEALGAGPLLVATLVLVADAVVTGGLHLDGLADVADGVASRRPADDAVRIMRDSAVGAGGLVAVVLVSLVRQAALLGVLGAEPPPWSLVAVPVAGRAALVLLLAAVPTRADGSLAAALPRPGASATVLALVLAAGVAALAGARPLAAATLALLAAAGYAAWWRRRFGALSGDGAGAGGVLAETVALLGLVVPG